MALNHVIASSRCLPPMSLVTFNNSFGVCVGKRHHLLCPTTKAFQALVPSGSMWIPVPDRAKISDTWNLKPFLISFKEQTYLGPSQTIYTVAAFLRSHIWINRLENTLALYNHRAAFSDDDAVFKLEIKIVSTNSIEIISIDTTYITKTAIENVQWTIILWRFHIFNIILHFHFDTVAFVIFATFEFLVAIFLHQPWQRPFFIGFPICLKKSQFNKKYCHH